MDVFGLAVTTGGAFLRAAAIAAAHRLGAIDALRGAGAAGLTLDELATAIGVGGGRRRLRRLCELLAFEGVLARAGADGGDGGDGGDAARFVLGEVGERVPVVAEAGWGLLADVIRDDRPLPEDDGEEGRRRYHAHLLAAGAAAADEVAALLEAAGGRALVDLGGGAGAYTAAFLARRADARATIVDDARVLELASAELAARGLGARVTLCAGDARTAACGDGFDVALLANLLHLHGPEACAALVAAAARAVAPGGVVAIKDLRVDDDRRGSREGLWFALNMAVYTEAGDVHPTAALRRWLADAGLVAIEERRLASAPDAIVVLGRRPAATRVGEDGGALAGGVDDRGGAGDREAVRALVAAPADREGRRARAREDGLVYLPRLVPEARLAPLRAFVEAALARRGWLVDGATDGALRLGRWDDPRWVDFLAEVLPSPAFRELAAAPELLAAVRDVVGGEPRLHVGDVCRIVSPGALDLATPAHQDAAYLRDPDGVWTAWIPLGACPLALGPLALLPGSHAAGLRPHAPVTTGAAIGCRAGDDEPWHASALAAGDVILFSSLTVHRALPNRTPDRLRVSVDYRYRA